MTRVAAPTGFARPGVSARRSRFPLLAGLALVCLAGVAFAVAISVDPGSYLVIVAVVVGLPIVTVAMFAPRVETSLVVLTLYLGMLDGYLRLKTGNKNLTLVRDGVFYAIIAGCLARLFLSRQKISFPPMTGWVLAFVAVVVVQVANPASVGVTHTLGALRPHLEFVPLFFFGYVLMRTEDRLRWFFLCLVVIAAANGVVSLIQFNLTPDELANWGPGYAARILGTGDVSGRLFVTDAGTSLVRPFGLGADTGVGGLMGLVAVAPTIALISQARDHITGKIAIFLCWGPFLAVATSQGRTVVVASLLGAAAYLFFTTVAQRLVPTLMALVVVLGFAYGGLSLVTSDASSGAFDRYKTITPSRLFSSIGSDRGGSLQLIPKIAQHHPFGGGLGSVGPAARFAGGGAKGLDGETEITFLLSEVGIIGALVYLGFHLRLVFMGFARLRRITDLAVRTNLAAIVATLTAMATTWLSTSSTAIPPTAPFFWFSAGVLAYWLATDRRDLAEQSPPPRPALTATG